MAKPTRSTKPSVPPVPAEPAAPRLPKGELLPVDFAALDLEPEIVQERARWTGAARGDASRGRWSEGEFERARLGAVAWAGAHLEDLHFRDCDLANANARGIYGSRVHFHDSRLLGTIATESTWYDTVWSGCSLVLSQWRFTKFTRVRFENCDLTGADFQNSDLRGSVFRDCNLTEAQFSFCQLAGADWRGSEIQDLRVDGPSLAGLIVTPFQAANLSALLGLKVMWGDDNR